MENLGIDWKLLVAQLINFGIFFIIFKKFVAKPFSKFLSEEKKREEESAKIMEKAKRMDEEHAEKEKEWKKKMARESEETIKMAKERAEIVKEDILKNAKKESEAILIKARSQIEEEKGNLYKEVKDKVSELSLFLVTQALREYLTQEAREKLTGYILKNLSKRIEDYENKPKA